MPISLDFFESAVHPRIAHFMKDGVHMTVAPHIIDQKANKTSGYEVFFWGSDEEGKMDFGKRFKDGIVSGGPDDFDEIADTYARRLDAGIKPEDMFKDIEEKNLRDLDRLVVDMEAGRLK